MPIKQTLYPKTKRVGSSEARVAITEKMDGSNLCFFKYDYELYIAQRNNIFDYPSAMESSDGLYKGMHPWLKEHGDTLRDELHDNACICGEWIGMGRLKYNHEETGRFMQFAKSRVTDDGDVFGLENIYYDRELFKWSYKSQELPWYIQPVPLVDYLDKIPSVSMLDSMYQEYTANVGRPVEGFIMIVNNTITKYVRMKNGTLTPHKS